ncbi:MAG: sensor histidine kinase [Conexibacter sp.]
MSSTPRWHRQLLPGALGDAFDGRRSARDWLVDATMSALALALGVIVLLDSLAEHSAALKLLDVLLGAVALALLWRRRPHPDAFGVFAGAASICSALAAGPLLVACFNVALRGSRRGLLATVALSAASAALFPLLYPPNDSYASNVLVAALVTAIAFGCGLFARVRREQLLALRERAVRLEVEQRGRIEQAREAERLRIAREMHDALGHRLSLVALHAGALEFRRDAPADEVADAAAVIRDTAHVALEELREVIGVLRSAEEGAPKAPQPTLASIPTLIEESRAAGMRVTSRFDVPRAEDAPAALGRTAYRIVQEGLTNARKHAPAAAVEVAVTVGERLVVRIASRRPAGGLRRPAAPPGSGSGLIGLGERVALAGGTLEHGWDPSGDFVLLARLPWRA